MNTDFRTRAILLGFLSVCLALVVLVLAFLVYQQQVAAPPVAPVAIPPNNHVSTENGLTVISLDQATQTQSGIETRALTAASQQAETLVFATVMDLQPLLDLRARYQTGLSEAEAAQAALASSSQEYQRNQALYRDEQNVSQKTLQAAQATWLADKAKAQATAVNVQALSESARQQFGAPVAHWLTLVDSPHWRALLEHQESLLRVVVSLGSPAVAPASMQIETPARQRLTAQLVSASPQSDPSLPGQAFIYRVAADLPSQVKLLGYLPGAAPASAAVFLPGAAIVWYGGQPWVYVQTDQQRFSRRVIHQSSVYADGLLAAQGFMPGESVVVSGAQLLLSIEQQPQVASSGCKDPECDD